MRTPSSTQPRNSGLDGIRAIAAGSVFVFHAWLYTRTPGTKPHWWDYTAIQFRTGLICFFVLSGYLLYRSFARAARAQAGPVSVGSYSARRVVRIIPAYYVAMLGALRLLGGAGDTPGVRLPPAEQWWLFPLFGQNFRGDTIMKLNPVTWTLCLEAMFYVLLPFLGIFAYRIAKGRWQPQVALMAGFVALGAIWNALVFDHGWGQVASKSLMAYMPYFAVGMLVAIWLVEREARGRTGPLSPRTTLWLALAGAALVVASGYWHATSGGPSIDKTIAMVNDLPAATGFALLVAGAAAGSGRSLSWLSWKPLDMFGVASYGFYLWHVPILLFLKSQDVLGDSFLVAFAIGFPLATLAGFLSWNLIERPLLDGTNRRIKARRAARAARGAQVPV